MPLNTAMAQKTVNIVHSDAGGSSLSRAPDFNALIVKIAREKDRASFIRLFDHFAPRVKSFLMRGGTPENVADDLAQETMLAVWQKAEAFDPAKASASTWIFTIARNKKIDALRKTARIEVDIDAIAPVEDDTPLASENLMRANETEIIAEAIKELPPEQAELIRQSFFEGKSHSEIAAEKNIPLGTVKSRMRLALERLRKGKNVKELWQ
jgi:RNA polymerase sigma factor (sigma-70 family)